MHGLEGTILITPIVRYRLKGAARIAERLSCARDRRAEVLIEASCTDSGVQSQEPVINVHEKCEEMGTPLRSFSFHSRTELRHTCLDDSTPRPDLL